MLSNVSANIFRFLFLIILQVFILNNVRLGGYINPYPYVLAIFLLPITMPRWAILVIGLITGFVIDVFSHTLGMHMAATVFLCYMRPQILQLLAPRGDYNFGDEPTLSAMGYAWFIGYSGILIFLHHIFLFYCEAFSTHNIFQTFGRVILSSLFTFGLVIIFQFLSFKANDR